MAWVSVGGERREKGFLECKVDCAFFLAEMEVNRRFLALRLYGEREDGIPVYCRFSNFPMNEARLQRLENTSTFITSYP